MLLVRRCLHPPSHQSVLTRPRLTHSLSCRSKKSEAISTYQQLLHENASLVSYVDSHNPTQVRISPRPWQIVSQMYTRELMQMTPVKLQNECANTKGPETYG
jgi:hypothetical protein